MLVRAIETFAHSDNGFQEVVGAGEILEDTDEVVKRHPANFRPVTATRVEQATGAPGERRLTQRPR